MKAVPVLSKGALGLGTLLLVGGLVAACDGGGGDGKTHLTVGLFGDFGYQALYDQFEKDHPNVVIDEVVEQNDQHHANLAQHLAAGTGASDVEAIEESFVAQFKAQPDQFVNLLDMGAGDLETQWLDWKWAQTLSPDGTYQIGLGTDIGSLAMCYRRDLFEQAGLPTDREAVSALWADGWQSYMDVGEQFESAGTNAHWFDSASNVFNAVLGQADQGYYDTDDNVIIESNPAVRDAWDLVTSAVANGESAGLVAFANDWNNGFQQGTFATVTCPAWMMGYIQDQAADSAGLWDIAAIPGGGGNWGGSFLTIPKQSEHKDLAYELITFLTAPEQESTVFTETGNLPSEPSTYDDPEIAGFTNPFFNDAPVGEIYTTAAKTLEPQYLGPKAGEIRAAVTNGLESVEQGTSADDAWDQVISDVNDITASS